MDNWAVKQDHLRTIPTKICLNNYVVLVESIMTDMIPIANI